MPGKVSIVYKLLNRQTYGSFDLKFRGRQRPLFSNIPDRLISCLKKIQPNDSTTDGQVFMGFTKDGHFLLSYKLDFCYLSFSYYLYWWKFDPNQPLRLVSIVKLFGDNEVRTSLRLTICQWPSSVSHILVHGDSDGYVEADDDKHHCYVTITAVPALNLCRTCNTMRKRSTEKLCQPTTALPVQCFQHSYAVHTKYELTPPFPKFQPSVCMKCDDTIVLNTGDSVAVLTVAFCKQLKNQQEETELCRNDCCCLMTGKSSPVQLYNPSQISYAEYNDNIANNILHVCNKENSEPQAESSGIINWLPTKYEKQQIAIAESSDEDCDSRQLSSEVEYRRLGGENCVKNYQFTNSLNILSSESSKILSNACTSATCNCDIHALHNVGSYLQQEPQCVTWLRRWYIDTLTFGNSFSDVDINEDYSDHLPIQVCKHGTAGIPFITQVPKTMPLMGCLSLQQMTLDIEQYITEAVHQNTELSDRFLSLTDYDVRILDIVPNSSDLVILIVHVLIQATPPRNSEAVYCGLPLLYKTGFAVCWNLASGECVTLLTLDLVKYTTNEKSSSSLSKDGLLLVQQLRKQVRVPLSLDKTVRMMTNDAVFKGEPLKFILDPINYIAVVR